MLRYNHGMVEKKWQERWALESSSARPHACAVLVPLADESLGLENARLMVLADFFSRTMGAAPTTISLLNCRESWLADAEELGLKARQAQPQQAFTWAVVPRDYVQAHRGLLQAREFFLCGRLLDDGADSLPELIDDFGADALRVYFLYMGPWERDYRFRWQGLVSAYRFVERCWRLAQHLGGSSAAECAADLQSDVQNRLRQGKPHTALAAVMGYIKHKEKLTAGEARVLATLLQPWTPHLSAELLELVASV